MGFSRYRARAATTIDDVLRPLRAFSSSSARFNDAGISADNCSNLGLLPHLGSAIRSVFGEDLVGADANRSWYVCVLHDVASCLQCRFSCALSGQIPYDLVD